jgi:hypothetical protein
MAWSAFRLTVLARKRIIVGFALTVPALVWWTARGDWLKPAAIGFGLVFWVVAMYITLREQCRAIAPAGHRLETVFAPDSLVIVLPSSTVELRWSCIAAIRVVGDFVTFTQEGQKTFTILPREVFPDEEVDRVRGLIARRDPSRHDALGAAGERP